MELFFQNFKYQQPIIQIFGTITSQKKGKQGFFLMFIKSIIYIFLLCGIISANEVESFWKKKYKTMNDQEYMTHATQPLFKNFYGLMPKKEALDNTFKKVNCNYVNVGSDECYKKSVTFDGKAYDLNLIFNVGLLNEVILMRTLNKPLPDESEVYGVFGNFLRVVAIANNQQTFDFVADQSSKNISEYAKSYQKFQTEGGTDFTLIYVDKGKIKSFSEKNHLLEMYSPSTNRYIETHLLPFKNGYIQKVIFSNFLTSIEINFERNQQKQKKEKF